MRLINFPLVLLSTFSILTPLYATPLYTEYSDHSLTPSLYTDPDNAALGPSPLTSLDDDDLTPYLHERGEVDNLPLPPVCKQVLSAAVSAGKAAFKFTRKTVCEEYKCKVAFKPVFEKYSVDPIRDQILQKWILGSLAKAGVNVQKMGVDVIGKYDKITDKCIRQNPAIIDIQDVCKADKAAFEKIKFCVMKQIFDLVMGLPKLLVNAEQGCQAALKMELVKKVATPTFKPNWRQMVKDFNKSPLCQALVSP